ncbi:hypothetical protein C1752_06184 [Acaryochloris thomasi RCC1774]|uniref:DUF7734 domain-containing protein n=1 Tax=Acaryochloris thomasi RCC1774 TaxID=1764569 RepID=A0A2W1JN42_9CYAN|nr:hypothetical protein [Acaryochloris thomasi]PZD71564.1 hypothetical protein C1752_06184 [Acaryochloris thomasi RCC1774]
MQSPGYRLEQYTLQHLQEVLLVQVESEGQRDEVVIFKGYSSSLTSPTNFDPDMPVLPEQARILTVDRLMGPYNPAEPQYLQRGLSWPEMQAVLAAEGL